MADGMDQRDAAGAPEEDGAAAERAFAALQAEVAALRGPITALAERARTAGPDYSPTLGAIVQELQGLGARLAAIERAPALATTPAQQAAEVRQQMAGAAEAVQRGLAESRSGLERTVRALEGLVRGVQEARAQRQREWLAAGIGAGLGLVLWYGLAWANPFGVGHGLAATLVGGDRWQAGAQLLHGADPLTWERMVRLYRGCPAESRTELCVAAMAVRTLPPTEPPAAAPAQPAPEGERAPGGGPAPASPLGRAGQVRIPRQVGTGFRSDVGG